MIAPDHGKPSGEAEILPVRAVKSTQPAETSARSTRRTIGKVERAARAVLADIDTDHAAGELLSAVAERLARDIDESVEVRDRVAASRELRDVLEALDTAVIPPVGPGASPEGGDDDDPFGIEDGPDLPPGMVDAPQL